MHPHDPGSDQVWSRLGLLVAELFVALAVIFLVGTTVGHVPPPPPPTPTPTLVPTPTPTVLINCGLRTTYATYAYPSAQYPAVQNPEGLRSSPPDTGAVSVLASTIQSEFSSETRVAGLVEVFGSGPTSGAGADLAKGVIAALKAAGGPFTSNKTVYQAFADTSGNYGSVYFYVFYYVTATVCN